MPSFSKHEDVHLFSSQVTAYAHLKIYSLPKTRLYIVEHDNGRSLRRCGGEYKDASFFDRFTVLGDKIDKKLRYAPLQ